MYPDDDLTLIHAPDAELIMHRLGDMLSFTAYPVFEVRKRVDWCAVPMESADHFDDEMMTNIEHAWHPHGETHYYARLLEPLINTPQLLIFPATRKGLEAFNRTCALFSYVLFPPDLEWMIICTKDDHWVVIGQRSFVETVIGSDIAQAYADFRAFADDLAALPKIQILLRHVAHVCATDYVEAEEGAWVVF